MDRRSFMKTSLAAAVIPALPGVAMAAAPAPKMGIAARYWAAYFGTANGQAALQAARVAGAVSEAEAKSLVMRSVARGGYAPAAAAVKTVATGPNSAAQVAHRRTPWHTDDVPAELRDLRAPITCDCGEGDLTP